MGTRTTEASVGWAPTLCLACCVAPSAMAELLKACVELVQSYNAGKCTVDSHATDFIARKRIEDEHDQRFLQQVFYGCTRYKKLLKIFISSLYFKHAGETQRADQTLYTVLAYLALLRLSELGFADFRALVLSQEHFKMTVFLRFLFDEENLRTWLRPEWTKHYEPSFVDEQLIDRIGTFIPQVHALEKVLAGRMASEAAKKEAAAEAARALAEGRGGSHKHTTPEPFDLTAPKPRLVPVPADEIDCTFKAGGVPASTYADAKQLKDRIALDKQKDANRVRMKAKYSDPRVQPFKLRVTERPSNLPRIKAEVEAARDTECTFDPPAAKPVPKPREGAGVVKLNSAAILREDNLYRKKQQSEAQLLGAYEQELRDSSEFDAWQARMRAADEESRMKEVERRRVETLLADEEAKEARLRKLNENRALAAALKVEHGENERKRAAAAAELHEAQRAIVTDVQSQRDNPKVAAEEVARENRARAADLRQDMEARAAAAAEERRIEDERRQDLIKQIRALELVPRERVTILDPTYTPQLGLLEEMSLAELRERLRMAEVERAEEEQLKRAKIVAAMQEKEEDLAARMERLKEMRELAAKQASAKRDAAAQEQAAVEGARRERLAEAQLEVHTKIEAKRASRRKEEEKLAEELKRIRIKNSFLGANKEAVERKKWESVESGASRELAARQGGAQAKAAKAAALDEVQRRQRLLNVQRAREAHEEVLRDYEARCAEAQFDATAAEEALAASREATQTRLGLETTYTRAAREREEQAAATGTAFGKTGGALGKSTLAQTASFR